MTQKRQSDADPHIAFMGDPLAKWGGAVDFLCFCVSALTSVIPGTSFLVLLPGKRTAWQTLRHWASPLKRWAKIALGKSIFNGHPPTREDLKRAMSSAGASIDTVDYWNSALGLAAAMRQCNAKVLLFCAESLGASFPLPWVGYIADLQHKRLPHWFSEKECGVRDKMFTKVLMDAKVVIVNSRDVIRDIEEFYPQYAAKLIALPFSPPAKSELFSNPADPQHRATYKLPRHYFLISNQFTIHKSHETAFKALQLVRDAGHDAHIVCTGDMYDYRWPEHSASLKALIENNGMSKYIRFLGYIPKDDQLAIMRGAVAVVQPTLFEGGPGGGAIYDAVSSGTPSIVSDIGVNLEIDLGVVRFFKAGSPEDLAEKMAAAMVNPPPRPSKDETLMHLTKRQQELGSVLLDASRIAVSEHKLARKV
jgi:glycosyltransferase involved in cell wall biosynthesis